MSAISVLWQQAAVPPASLLLQSMLQAQHCYGPYRTFAWPSQPGRPTHSNPAHPNIALGGNLMHLLPEDPLDAQPLWAPDRSACLVADVRLDNRPDLIRDLALTQPEQLADSAILLAAWLCWGAACLDQIVGAFAFAVWTPARQELFAARDHSGERPLFYHRAAHLFALASMPKGLLALPGVFRGFNERRLADGLLLSHPDWHKSYFDGIERVPPGHLLRVRPGHFEITPYWHPSNARPIRFKRDDDYLEALLEIFDRATEARLRSPREIGTQLSSGLDSSSVTASAARLLAARGQRLTALTAVARPGFHGRGLPGKLVDEAPGAADVARLYPNIDHVLVSSEALDLVADLKAWTDAMDEPAQNGINLLWISAILDRARRSNIGVMLQGAYGNGTLSFESGNALRHLFRRGRWLKLFQAADNFRNQGDMSFRASFVNATDGLLPAFLRRRLIPGIDTLSLDFTAAHPELIQKYNLFQTTFGRIYGNLPPLHQERKQLFERFDFAPLNAAVQARTGIDPRDPTGDKRIWDFCYGIPIEQYIHGGHSRALVRRAMRHRLPPATLARYTRGQQGADWYLTVAEALPALREELAQIDHSPTANHILDLPRLHQLLDTWPTSGHETGEVTSSWNYALTRGITTGYFLRTHPAPPPQPHPSTLS